VLSGTDYPIEEAVRQLGALGLAAGYLAPTFTMLDKSIMDAHAGLREYLVLHGVHDYERQEQGTQSKIVVAATLLEPTSTRPSEASLYRPQSKKGDPRIWFTGLKSFALPGNLLAVVAHERHLYVLNVSDQATRSALADSGSPIRQVLARVSGDTSPVARELLMRLRTIAGQGYVTSLRSGDTGIGYTLETLLGIAANSSRSPDYKGIEIKAKRLRQVKTRQTLFSNVPSWTKSRLTALQMIDTYGYVVDGRRQLYCTISNQPNSQRLLLKVSEEPAELYAMGWTQAGFNESALSWDLPVLQQALASKHADTFWVSAETRRDDRGIEEFQFTTAAYTRRPYVSNLPILLDTGVVTVDLLLHEQFSATGSRRVRDHGYLFRMWPDDMPALFPPPLRYDLLT
jgi:hypothetical protein